jgi:hypothetical protein
MRSSSAHSDCDQRGQGHFRGAGGDEDARARGQRAGRGAYERSPCADLIRERVLSPRAALARRRAAPPCCSCPPTVRSCSRARSARKLAEKAVSLAEGHVTQVVSTGALPVRHVTRTRSLSGAAPPNAAPWSGGCRRHACLPQRGPHPALRLRCHRQLLAARWVVLRTVLFRADACAQTRLSNPM